MFKENQKEKIELRTVCDVCGKPIANKAKSDVTRYLSFESRCTCVPEDVAAKENAAMVAAAGEEEQVESKALDLAAAENLGERYEVLEQLGEGGMGAVYKVRDKELGKTFAVKMLRPQLVEDGTARKRFEQEAQAASNLTHANLVAVYDYGMGTKGSPYIVMDYLDGKSLGDILQKQGYLDVPRAVDIFVQCAEAIAHAHRKGVIHRDIKPNNIIVEANPNGTDFVKIVDFGIAKILPTSSEKTRDLTQTGDIFGTPLYMSPEQCLGNKLDAHSDIYAFGCVMYEALTGIAPFNDQNPIKIILKHVNEDAKPISKLANDYSVPADLEYVVLRCLQKDPENRYENMDTLVKDLEAIRDHQPIKRVAWKSSADPAKKQKPVSYFAKLTAFAAIIFVAAIWFLPKQAPSLDGYNDALSFDTKSYQYFVSGQYDQAAPLLQFGVATYEKKIAQMKAEGKDVRREEALLADNLQHLGKCYMMMEQYEKAAPYYERALEIYDKFGMYTGSMMPEAIRDYGTVLKKLGRTEDLQGLSTKYKSSS